MLKFLLFFTIMKTNSDFELFDYEILNHATYLKAS